MSQYEDNRARWTVCTASPLATIWQSTKLFPVPVGSTLAVWIDRELFVIEPRYGMSLSPRKGNRIIYKCVPRYGMSRYNQRRDIVVSRRVLTPQSQKGEQNEGRVPRVSTIYTDAHVSVWYACIVLYSDAPTLLLDTCILCSESGNVAV